MAELDAPQLLDLLIRGPQGPTPPLAFGMSQGDMPGAPQGGMPQAAPAAAPNASDQLMQALMEGIQAQQAQQAAMQPHNMFQGALQAMASNPNRESPLGDFLLSLLMGVTGTPNTMAGGAVRSGGTGRRGTNVNIGGGAGIGGMGLGDILRLMAFPQAQQLTGERIKASEGRRKQTDMINEALAADLGVGGPGTAGPEIGQRFNRGYNVAPSGTTMTFMPQKSLEQMREEARVKREGSEAGKPLGTIADDPNQVWVRPDGTALLDEVGPIDITKAKGLGGRPITPATATQMKQSQRALLMLKAMSTVVDRLQQKGKLVEMEGLASLWDRGQKQWLNISVDEDIKELQGYTMDMVSIARSLDDKGVRAIAAFEGMFDLLKPGGARYTSLRNYFVNNLDPAIRKGVPLQVPRALDAYPGARRMGKGLGKRPAIGSPPMVTKPLVKRYQVQ